MRARPGSTNLCKANIWKYGVGLATALLIGGSGGPSAFGQTAPENLRIDLEPAKPGVRSILIDKKYKPIISRDENGVVIDTIGSGSGLPSCSVALEITLENSRVLHRNANICSGNRLLVEVDSDSKPGATARVVGDGAIATPAQTEADRSSPEIIAEPSNETLTTPSDNSGAAALPPSDSSSTAAPEQQDTLLKPLESAGDPLQPPSDFSAIVNESLSRQDGTSGSRTARRDILVQPSNDRVWESQTGNTPGVLSKLSHTVPQTSDADFTAVCQTQTGSATIVFSQTGPSVQEGVTLPVRVSAGDFSATYSAIGSSTNNQYGQSFPQVALPMSDPIWEALIRQTELSVSVQGLPPYVVSLSGSAAPVRLFQAACAEAQQIVSADGLPLSGTEPGADRLCSELGSIRSQQGTRPGQIVFRNMGQTPVEVHWIDYNGGERPYARLQPGQILEQETYVSHAWLVRGSNGQCRGIYVSRTPYREVVLTGVTPSVVPNTGIGGFAQPGGPFDQPSSVAGPRPPADIGGGFGQPQPLSGPQSAAGQVADYLCTAGVDLNVQFSPDGNTATVAEMGFGVVTLARQGGANTFNYAGQGYALRGQIQNATWSRPGRRDVFCARR
ncbi:von Hippel-Lindau disease tumor suppressor protein [Roseibium hamelinense]|uniref:von Hippel-Lindau disease tumor suppressor protein n=1 Tax=Roseibium hamelinense TaxID=150831 RepID=A0A562SNT7_9HYPH|nr:von Hippel-Lindau disease tumor suppressor protein [Roseibium hamelinense]